MGASMPTGVDASERQAEVARMLSAQAEHCRVMGSTLYQLLLDAAAADCLAGGPTWRALAPLSQTGWESALALRFMAAVHRLVLEGRLPDLAEFYPSAGGTLPPSPAAWDAFRSALSAMADEVTQLSALPCQTNEVGRCAGLVVGFLTVAGRTQLPLRLLEVGASAGLNLRWDAYSYADDTSDRRWGPPNSPVQLSGEWEIDPWLLGVPVSVAERSGCDPSPIDATTADGRLRLESALWSDQTERFNRLRAAFEVAQHIPAAVEPASAGNWIPSQLSALPEGTATVVFHSVVWQYLSEGDRIALRSAVADAAERATKSAPLAWLRMEADKPGRVREHMVRVAVWPSGHDTLLAVTGAHGFPVRRAG